MNLVKDTSSKIKIALFNPENKLSLIPNWLSFSRTFGGVILPLMAYGGASLKSLTITSAIIALTDFLDGKAARLLVKEETSDGALLDALSDKIFSGLLILAIIPKNPIFLINGILEGSISFINAKALSNGGNPKSNFLGKVKMWPLSVSLIFAYLSMCSDGSVLGFSKDELMDFSTLMSTVTIPLEVINVKDYMNKSKNFILKK